MLHASPTFTAQMEPQLDAIGPWLLVHCEDVVELEITAKLHELASCILLDEIEIAILARLTPLATRAALLRLCACGLVTRTGGEQTRYRYAVADPKLRTLIERVVQVYRSAPLSVMRVLTVNAVERARTARMLAFADCFRIHCSE